MKAKEIMTSRLVTVQPDTSIAEIAKLMMEWSISAVPVVDDNFKIVGIVSEGDLIRREEVGTAEKQRSWWLGLLTATDDLADEFVKMHGKAASDVMTSDVVTVGEDTELTEIADILEKRGIKRVPVVRDDRLVGIVSRANFIQCIATAKDVRVVPVNTDDEQIREEVANTLRKETWASLGTTNVTVANGMVRFWGTVASDAERKASRIMAEGVAGVTGVEDNRGVSQVVPGGGL